ncbi:hypothetical protein LZ31DRAFT_92427 [Colletotrichum somersetense]|nr:hypothetical protein LZ31DRAFT_92427 [Colletotrichum somersetense]
MLRREREPFPHPACALILSSHPPSPSPTAHNHTRLARLDQYLSIKQPFRAKNRQRLWQLPCYPFPLSPSSPSLHPSIHPSLHPSFMEAQTANVTGAAPSPTLCIPWQPPCPTACRSPSPFSFFSCCDIPFHGLAGHLHGIAFRCRCEGGGTRRGLLLACPILTFFVFVLNLFPCVS